MVYTSEVFLFAFFPLFLLFLLLLQCASRRVSQRKRAMVMNGYLVLSSTVFYLYGEDDLWWPLLFALCTTFAGACFLGQKGARSSLWVLVVCLCANMGLLVYFKYTLFIFGESGFGIIYSAGVLPLGLSFFVVQNVSYLVDVYRGDIVHERNFLKYAAYLTFFPQLIAGPIVRFSSVSRFFEWRVEWRRSISDGVFRVCIGVAKKILIADRCAVFVDDVFAIEGQGLPASVYWYGVLCYSIQILFDFSAYSDIAIGIGKIVGVDIPENFDKPYTAKSIRDFWRRWHISLSTWFRDYVYIPFGGSRYSKTREYGALLSVFVLCGLWHGASWNFVLWGVGHGILILCGRVPRQFFPDIYWRVWSWFGSTVVFVLVALLWVLFRSDSLDQALVWYRGLFGFGSFSGEVIFPVSFLSLEVFFAVGIGLFLARVRCNRFVQLIFGEGRLELLRMPFAFGLLILSCFYVFGTSYSPFIYFRF